MTDPLLADAAEARPLTGLSGAQVTLVTRDGRHWFVRKAARDAASSGRLRRQLAKQRSFEALGTPGVRVPRVLDEGELDDRFYFDMEFIRGSDGVSYLRRATYPEVKAVGARLCEYLESVAERRLPAAGNERMFDAMYRKLCDVQRRTDALPGDTLAKLFLSLEVLRGATENLVPTVCHGDLTLENIVIDPDGMLWFLDLLDAPYEHWWQDVAKLHQDLDGGWYQLGHQPIARCVVDYLSHQVLAAATRHDSTYRSVHWLLLAFAFVRILPYARTAGEREFVRLRVDHYARLASGEMRTV